MSIPAGELGDQLAERYRTDPDYRAEVDLHQSKLRAIWEERERNLAPFHDALRAAGVTETYDRQTGAGTADPRIFEIALDHLRRDGYDDFTRGSIARHFETRGAAPYWDQLTALYIAAAGEQERDALAAALAKCAGTAEVNDLKKFVNTPELGSSRVLLLRSINRLDRKGGRDFVLQFLDDPQLGVEVDRIRRRLSRRA